MTTDIELRFKQRITQLKTKLENSETQIACRLNEKGVECAILMPLIEDYLGFDPVEHIEYECASAKRNDQRFDFLLDGNFVIEAKRLDRTVGEIQKQIEQYIHLNDTVNFGLLTNGFDFCFFVQSSYITGFLSGNDDLTIPIKKNVLKVLEIDLENEHFFQIMKLFERETYQATFEAISRYVLTQYNQSKATKIVGDRELNEVLRNEIMQAINIKPGIFLDKIKSGELHDGQALVFNNGDIELTVHLTAQGRIKLEAEGIKILNPANVFNGEFDRCVDLMRNDWSKGSHYFDSTRDLIREATGKKKLAKGKYEFVPVETERLKRAS